VKILVGFRAAADNCFMNAVNAGQNTAYVNFT